VANITIHGIAFGEVAPIFAASPNVT